MSSYKEINIEEFKLIINKYKNVKGPLIPLLHEAENLFGYIPIEIQNLISKEIGISNAEINGVASFYSMFHTEPTGKHHIGVCTGTVCHLNGSKKILKHLERKLGIKEGENTSDGQFTVVPVKCIGNCEKGPNIALDDKVYEGVTIEKLDLILEEYRKK